MNSGQRKLIFHILKLDRELCSLFWDTGPWISHSVNYAVSKSLRTSIVQCPFSAVQLHSADTTIKTIHRCGAAINIIKI